jgi:hypothetical protein
MLVLFTERALVTGPLEAIRGRDRPDNLPAGKAREICAMMIKVITIKNRVAKLTMLFSSLASRHSSGRLPELRY